MLIHRIEKHEDCWLLQGGCGCHWRLDRALPTTKQFDIGTMGTRRSEGVKLKSPLHLRFAETLAELGRSVILVDTRRNGCGAQGSWTPLELATLVPEHFSKMRLNPTCEYMYMHLPILAPSLNLLTQSRATRKQAETSPTVESNWEAFRDAYLGEITNSQAVSIGRALVEHATEHSAIAVFLCAEPFESDFDQLSREKQNANYCHRFTLTQAICDSLQADMSDAEIRRIDLSMGKSPHSKLISNSPSRSVPVISPVIGSSDQAVQAEETNPDHQLSQKLSQHRFVDHLLDDNHHFYSGTIPEDLCFDESSFEALWSLHPETFHRIVQYGRLVDTPRWQQAYGHDYHYTGRVNKALDVPAILEPILTWCQAYIDKRLNGILVNWYDAALGHYIGRHRDSVKNLAPDSPIVTISCGAERKFRLSPYGDSDLKCKDFAASDGCIFVMPYDTNRSWKHEVLKGKLGRRISITLRAFVDEIS